MSPQKIRSIKFTWGEETYFLFSGHIDLEKIETQDYKIIRIFSTDLNFSNPKYPFCSFGHTKIISNPLRFFYVQAIKGDIQNFHYVKNVQQEVVGVHFETRSVKQTMLSGLGGRFDEVFQNISLFLPAPNQIVRCWHFIETIHQNYTPFNLARDRFFSKKGITAPYPAATGIEADLKTGPLNVCLDSITGPSDQLEITTLGSDLQKEADTYGPKFSRGKVLHFKKEGLRKIYISGTSSIDQGGRSVFCHEPEQNVSYVLDCVDHLLKKANSSFQEIVMSIIYSQDQEHYQAFLKIYKKKQWEFPILPLFVNICRKNLSFEMECLAQ